MLVKKFALLRKAVIRQLMHDDKRATYCILSNTTNTQSTLSLTAVGLMALSFSVMCLQHHQHPCVVAIQAQLIELS